MSHRFVSILTVIAAVTIAATTGLAAPAWVTYRHPQLGFSLNYPGSWAPAGEVSGVDFMALGPNAAGLPGVRLNVNVTHDTIPSGTSVDVYHDKTQDVLKSIFNAYRLLQVDRVKTGSFPAMLRQYTWKANNGVEIYQLQLVTVDGTRGFIATGTTGAASGQLEGEAKLLANILMTFRPR